MSENHETANVNISDDPVFGGGYRLR